MIKKVLNVFLILALMLNLFACAGSRAEFDPAQPSAGYSVQVTLSNGRILEGLLLRAESDKYQLIDSQSHKQVIINKKDVRAIKKSPQEYDFEGNVITAGDMADAEGISRTLGYGIGGVVLGAGAGFGLGVALAAAATVPFLYPIAALSIAGGWYFGKQGADRDEQLAVDTVRSERLEAQKMALQQKLEKARHELELKKMELKNKKAKNNGN